MSLILNKGFNSKLTLIMVCGFCVNTQASLSPDSFACEELMSNGFYEQGIEPCKRAAEEGSPEAGYNLGVAYRNGLGVEKDYEKALEWFSQAAYQEHVGAEFNLGNMYIKGEVNFSKDYENARYWYLKAANHGHPKAQYNLGYMYGLGLGVEESPREAKMWMAKSCEQGFQQACYVYQLYVAGGY